MDADVVVIGGGATGAGVVRDVAMRGYSAVLLDKADLGQGTTGRYHGLLHSGGRYVVSDTESATECAEENEIVTRIHADAVEKTGGLFVVTPEDPLDFSDQWTEGATKSKVPWTEISVAEALRREPRLNPGIKRAFAVHDGTVDGWQMVWGAARSAIDHGAQVLTYTEVTEIVREGDQVTAVIAHDLKKDEQVTISTRFVINTAGPWAGRIADLVGCHDVDVVPGRGIMIAMNHRLVNTVVNRCIYPADGDILVPVHTVSIIGTTDVKADDPQRLAIPRNEVQQMLDSGEALIPGFRDSRAVHAWAGARPLFKDKRVAVHRHPPHVARHEHPRPRHPRRRQGHRLDHRRQAHDLPPDGQERRRRDVRAARGGPPLHHRPGGRARLHRGPQLPHHPPPARQREGPRQAP
jgi:glycerol-3-phosphate dehydrogenase